MSAKKKKSWREKLADSKGLPKTGKIEGKMTTRWGTGTMVIPAPVEVDELMRRVPEGKLETICRSASTCSNTSVLRIKSYGYLT